MAIGPGSSSKQQAFDNRIGATDEARVRVVSGKGGKLSEQGSIQVTDKGQLNTGLQLSNVSGGVTIEGAEGIAFNDFRDLLADEREANAANNALLAQALLQTTSAGLVTPPPPGDPPDKPDSAAGPGVFDKIKTWWTDLDTKTQLLYGAGAAVLLWFAFKPRR